MMNRLITLLILVLAAATTSALAQTRYISDELRVPLRSSPCSRCAILHQGLPAGTKLQQVEVNDDGWSHVTSASGLDGWLQTQYLVSEPIARDQLQQARTKLNDLEQQNTILKQQLDEFQSTSETLETQLNSALEAKRSVDDELTSVRQISSDALNLHQQNQELLKRNRILQSEIDILTASRDQLRSDATRKWFMYGAIAVFLGALLTALIPRLKPRKKFSEWA